VVAVVVGGGVSRSMMYGPALILFRVIWNGMTVICPADITRTAKDISYVLQYCAVFIFLSVQLFFVTRNAICKLICCNPAHGAIVISNNTCTERCQYSRIREGEQCLKHVFLCIMCLFPFVTSICGRPVLNQRTGGSPEPRNCRTPLDLTQ